jgi:hypothetical protein
MKAPSSHEFLHGVAMVLAELSRVDEPELARYVAHQYELSLPDFVAAGVDEVDLEELRLIFALNLELNDAPDL